jgi:1,4-dihydroxy-2-naphthoyl-CoA hydrolase
VEADVETELLDRGLTAALGFRYGELSADCVTLEWTTAPSHLQPFGLVHGGVYCAAVETAASLGAQLWYGERGHVVGVSNQTDFFRSTTEGKLQARGVPIHRGRTQQVWAVEVTDEGGRLVARGQVRLQNIPAAGPAAPNSEPTS